ncbi:hypothetical protein AJ79_01646 [Helicocarpus griseus UAMH5409]|uniref:Uncharacterized protein n=1 Tax=Helicocarpus griseus UAMH5409 TaxID=1447875 RepID=A0A2B7Y5N1_9EURO|nr:hypothetical protein AJ79_01646 [Helicocarpus griseus UAMH5409]
MRILRDISIEAAALVVTASDAFDTYNSDKQIQKIAKSFFGINPNDEHNGTQSREDQEILDHVQSNPRQPSQKNPENYAWAAAAIYLARNGAKRDYSSGRSRNLQAPLEFPS